MIFCCALLQKLRGYQINITINTIGIPEKLVHRCTAYVAHSFKIQQHCPVKDLIDPAETGPACM